MDSGGNLNVFNDILRGSYVLDGFLMDFRTIAKLFFGDFKTALEGFQNKISRKSRWL